MPEEIAMRHRPPHFGHIFSGDHYAAGYYSYMWSEVMDADAFGAFEEAGNIFDPAVAKRLHDDIYSTRRIASIRTRPTRPSAAARPSPTRCCAAAACSTTPRRPDAACAPCWDCCSPPP